MAMNPDQSIVDLESTVSLWAEMSEVRPIATEMSITCACVLLYADRTIMEADPHKPLRQDVRLLGELLGETLRTHEGPRLLETVERVRTVAKSSRARADRDFQA